MKEIKLTNGGIAFVDDRDYERVAQYPWFRITINRNHYATRNVNREGGRQSVLMMHRFILGLWPNKRGPHVDHRDNNGLNNQRANLRCGHHRDTVRNQRIQTRAKSSRYKGVSWKRACSRWEAGICVHGVTVYLGRFETETEAAAAYDNAAIQYFGEFAGTNAMLTSPENLR